MNPAVLSSYTSVHITFLASFLIWIMFGGLIILWFIDGRIKKEIVLHSLIASVLAWVLAEMIKSLFPTTRPYQMMGSVPLTLTLLHTDGSFPSAHTAVAFALAVTVWLHDRKYGWFFIIAAMGVGYGRILSNVHYFVDVIGGALIGTFLATTVDKLHVFGFLKRRKA